MLNLTKFIYKIFINFLNCKFLKKRPNKTLEEKKTKKPAAASPARKRSKRVIAISDDEEEEGDKKDDEVDEGNGCNDIKVTKNI